MKEVSILWHLGLGDAIICNGLVRHYAEQYSIVKVPCYAHNYNTVSFMFRDNKKIEVHPIENPEEAIELFGHNEAIKLGHYSKQPFDTSIFDIELYRHANVPFKYRWEKFHVELDKIKAPWRDQPFAFVHEDFKRQFLIRRELVKMPILTPLKDGEFFDNYATIESCKQVHCINSSFLHFWDSVPDVEGQELFYHKYARRNADHPHLKKAWRIL